MTTQRQNTAQRAQKRARWYHRLLTGFYGATAYPQGSHRTPKVSGSEAPHDPTGLGTTGEPGEGISAELEFDLSGWEEQQYRARVAATRTCEVCGFIQYPAPWERYCSTQCREHAERMMNHASGWAPRYA